MNDTKRIVCYGDSNTWGYNAQTGERYRDQERWTVRLQALLGSGYTVQEEGISGRTTVFDDPLNEGLNGLRHLATALGTHSPLDALVLMLGTNDCKQRFSASPQNIADGVARLIEKARQLPVWRSESRILLVAPIVIQPRCYASPVAGEMGEGCVEKSRQLPTCLQQTAREKGCAFWDCNEAVTANTIDFMHFDLASNERFAAVVQQKILDLWKV